MENLSVYDQMEEYGVEYVTNIDVLSTLTGADKKVLTNLITEFGSLQKACANVAFRKADFTKRQIQKIELIGELFKRNLTQQKTHKVNDPKVIANLYMDEMRYLEVEHFNIILLNTKNHILKNVNISKGTLNASLVHPREVFKEAIKQSANSMILLHNHPSGDPTPSNEDVNITNKLIDVGNLVGIRVLDHIIIGDGRYVSLKERNLM